MSERSLKSWRGRTVFQCVSWLIDIIAFSTSRMLCIQYFLSLSQYEKPPYLHFCSYWLDAFPPRFLSHHLEANHSPCPRDLRWRSAVPPLHCACPAPGRRSTRWFGQSGGRAPAQWPAAAGTAPTSLPDGWERGCAVIGLVWRIS